MYTSECKDGVVMRATRVGQRAGLGLKADLDIGPIDMESPYTDLRVSPESRLFFRFDLLLDPICGIFTDATLGPRH